MNIVKYILFLSHIFFFAYCSDTNSGIDPGTRTDMGSNIGGNGPTIVAASLSSHTCAILRGKALCWGNGGHGRLGNGASSNQNRPVQVMGLESGVTAIAVGSEYSCAVVNGNAMCWGNKNSGRLGNGDRLGTQTSPTNVATATDSNTDLSGVTGIWAKGSHTCALLSNSFAMCWGSAGEGETGSAFIINAANQSATLLFPTPVITRQMGSKATKISAGARHTCSMSAGSGEMWCWGNRNGGVLGDGSRAGIQPTPVRVFESGVTDISAGSGHTCAVVNGGAMCWGDDFDGRLGNGTGGDLTRPGQVEGLDSGVTAISAGRNHTCAVVNGGAMCWGRGFDSQLGNNSKNVQSAPAQVMGLDSGVTSISAGGKHTCAVVEGIIKCWGTGGDGQLGNGSNSDSLVPVNVDISGF